MRGCCIAALSFLLLAAAQDADLGQLERQYRQARAAADSAAAETALNAIVRVNTPDAVTTVLGGLQAVHPDQNANLYFLIVRAATSFSNREALAALGAFIARNKAQPFARDLAAELQGNYERGVAAAMDALLQDGTDEMKLLAADHLSEVPCAESVDLLIRTMQGERRDSLLKRKCRDALVALCGNDLGADTANWANWWQVNRREDFAGADREHRDTGTCVDTLDRTRDGQYRRLREARVIILAGRPCLKPGGDHNMDHIDRLLEEMELRFETVTKDVFEADNYRVPEDTIAILAQCTMWRTHCGCVRCQPGGAAGMRLYQCTGCNIHTDCSDVLADAGIRKVREFVDRGGYLFTEDWAMEDIVARAWPQIVGPGPVLNQADVDITPSLGTATHPYLRRIFQRPPHAPTANDGSLETSTSVRMEDLRHTWKIDQDSPSIDIRDAARVQVLITSDQVGQMATQAGQADPSANDPNAAQNAQQATDQDNNSQAHSCRARHCPPGAHNAVAISFFPGRPARFVATGGFEQDTARMSGGRVVHVLSHFGKQDSQQDEYTLQNLLLNFLIEANERYRAAHPQAAQPQGDNR